MAHNRNSTAESKEVLGLNRITKKRILELCKKDKLYQTPSLNDVLYLHYQGFQSIENLEEYTELKCLWLECNTISEIQGLDNQTKLKCLFLQSNLIKKIENLKSCKELDTINLSQNHIRKIENCSFEILPVLNTLNISSNYLKDCESLKELENCRNLSVLDVSNNRIDDILVVKIFSKMPELKVLVLQGNPVVSKIPQYRKTMILECKKLTYLDSRPVFDKDRDCAEAWKRGGYEEERKEHERWNRKERKKMRDSVNVTIQMRNKTRKSEDQLSLLVSSDSEDESDAKKLKKQQDSIWDEVTEDSKSDTNSSDMNISSSTSVTSSNNSNFQDTSLDGETNEPMEISHIDKQTILNDSLMTNTNIVSLAESEDIESILKIIKDSRKEIHEERDLQQIDDGNDNIREVQERYKVSTNENNPVNNITCESRQNDSILKVIPEHNFELDTRQPQQSDKENICNDEISELSHNSCGEYSKDQFEQTEDARCHAILNNISKTENTLQAPLKRVQLQIETLNTKEEENLKELEDVMNTIINNEGLERESPRQVDASFSSQTQIETFNAKEDENYEPLKELENAMSTIIKNEHLQKDSAQQLDSSSSEQHMKTPTELQYEQECSKVNHQLQKDFEQLSTNMDIFMTELQKDKEERQEVIEALFDHKRTCNENSSGSSDNEDNFDEQTSERMIAKWDRETKLKGGKQLAEDDVKTELPKIWINDESYGDEDSIDSQQNEEVEDSENLISQSKPRSIPGESINQNDGIEIPENCSLKVSELDRRICDLQEIQDDSTNLDIKYFSIPMSNTNNSSKQYKNENVSDQVIPLTHVSHEDQKKTAAEHDDFEYTPMDMKLLSRNSHAALNYFEKETTELTELLQKLENRNEELFPDINTETNCQSEEYFEKKTGEKVILQEKKEKPFESQKILKLLDKEISHEIINEDSSSESSVGQIIENIIESLEFKHKNYEFDIHSDDKYNYSAPKMEQKELSPSQTIPGFVEPFKLFFKKIVSKNREEMENVTLETPAVSSEERNINKTIDERNSNSLKSNLEDLNNDTFKSLDAKLKQIKDKQYKKIHRMVDRVYAQKDRYNDTLEVIDGKLVVCNKYTGEITESLEHSSDTDYDTAQSDEGEEGDCCIKSNDMERDIKCQLKEEAASDDQRVLAVNPAKYWSYCKTNPNRDIESHDIDDSNSDESNDEFYSLDPQTKSTLYGNIDEDFLKTLTLEHLKITEQDEHHIIQCARSYEEIKKCLEFNKEEKCLTKEENELLEKMIERKSKRLQEIHENPVQTFSIDDELTKEENRLLNKMIERTKKMEPYEKDDYEDSNVKTGGISYNICKEPIKIFEYDASNCSIDTELYVVGDAKGIAESDDNTTKVIGNDIFEFVFEDPKENKNFEENKEQNDKRELEEKNGENNFVESQISCQKFRAENADLSFEKRSEEEKNDVESNIDVEGIVMDKNMDYGAGKDENYIQEIQSNYDNVDNSQCLTTNIPPNIFTNPLINDLPTGTSDSRNSTYYKKLPAQGKILNSRCAMENFELPTFDGTDEGSSSHYIDNFENFSGNIEQTNTSDVEVLECNLEIIDCNDDIIDTITVNAEVHY